MVSLRTNVYIDGFNLYYGAVRGTPYKWLNLHRLAEILFPEDRIHRIWYFTARVNPRPHDPTQLQRQQFYLRALRTLPTLDIVFGQFRERRTRLPFANPPPGGPKTVEVIKPEEKGTDVNLATQLLVDGFKRNYEHAVVISNDSDLATPMRYVREELNLKVSVVNPSKTPTHDDLEKAATYVKRLRRNHLVQSQFPTVIQDQNGRFSKPNSW